MFVDEHVAYLKYGWEKFKKLLLAIADITLRDGTQCPGASVNLREGLEIARQLERLGVAVIEAGFPVSSKGNFETVYTIAQEIQKPIICALARCRAEDIESAGAAVKPAGSRGRIHVFLATSKIHRDAKFKGKAESEILRLAVEGVKHAKTLVQDVQFSPEDATRTRPEFLVEICRAALDAGANVFNIPDTVGWAVPEQYASLVSRLFREMPEFQSGKAIISVHCHDDLGLAVANSLAGVQAGARQVECTINGIGERAGNAALEEIVMALKTRQDFFSGLSTEVNTREITKASRLVERMTGMMVQRNKAIVGANAFAHSSGIHSDGMLKDEDTYQIIKAVDVGLVGVELPLDKGSGRNALSHHLNKLGYQLTASEIDRVFAMMKALGDKKVHITDAELSGLVGEVLAFSGGAWSLVSWQIISGNNGVIPMGCLKLEHPTLGSDSPVIQIGRGDGPVDALFTCLKSATGVEGKLRSCNLSSLSEGSDAEGECIVQVAFGNEVITGRAASTDMVEGPLKACLNAFNRFLAIVKAGKKTISYQKDLVS